MEQTFPMESLRAKTNNGWKAYNHTETRTKMNNLNIQGFHQNQQGSHRPQWVFENGRWVDKIDHLQAKEKLTSNKQNRFLTAWEGEN